MTLTSRSARRRRSYIPIRLVVLFALLALSLGAAGCGGTGGGASGTKAAEAPQTFPPGPDLGAASVAAPEADSSVAVAGYGDLAAGQIGVLVSEPATGTPDAAAASKAVAESVATALGGSVTGEIAFMNAFQVTFPPNGEAGLVAALEKAQGVEGVELAFPNQTTFLDMTVKGVRCSAVSDDPAYEGENARPYQMIGVENAWAIVRASGLELQPVQVGITDDGLYRKQGEFDGETEFETPESADQLENLDPAKNAVIGSHGTAVAGIVGANPDNGGQVGVASVLGKKLKVSSTNVFSGKYSRDTTAAADPSNPVIQTKASGKSWAIGDLAAITEQIKRGSTIINCSWGSSDAHPSTAAFYKRFFEKMAVAHPKVIFVCSAGNNGAALDGTKRYPSGLDLPNMITVGCLENDGSAVDYSNRSSGNFTVDIAAPGHRVVAGAAKFGKISNIDGGTSFATPQVTSVAALLRSLDPNLTAAELKDIIKQTATTSFTDPKTGVQTAVPADVGGGCVAADLAVLKVVNKLRAKAGLTPLTMDDIAKLNLVDLVATGEPGAEWGVSAGLPGLGSDAADASMKVDGKAAVDGAPTQNVTGGSKAEWQVKPDAGSPTVHVKRSDTSACSRVTLGMQPFKLKSGVAAIAADPAAGDQAVKMTLPKLVMRVKPKAGSPDVWEVTGKASSKVDGMKRNAQTFYGTVNYAVDGTFDPVTGVLSADWVIVQNIKYNRMTGYDNIPRKGNWTERFEGKSEFTVSPEATSIPVSVTGEYSGSYKSQRDNKKWDSGTTGDPWAYNFTFVKEPQ